jgi:hypothetical protein
MLPTLPTTPFTLAIVGPANSGKTTLVKAIIAEYADTFGAVYPFTGDACDAVITHFEAVKSAKRDKPILFVLDDVVTWPKRDHEFFANARHHNISIIMACQSYSSYAATLRLQFAHFMFLGLVTDTTAEIVSRELNIGRFPSFHQPAHHTTGDFEACQSRLDA